MQFEGGFKTLSYDLLPNVCTDAILFTGNCIKDLASDICDENTIPLRCGNGGLSCLCKEGYTPGVNDTCLGKFRLSIMSPTPQINK